MGLKLAMHLHVTLSSLAHKQRGMFRDVPKRSSWQLERYFTVASKRHTLCIFHRSALNYPGKLRASCRETDNPVSGLRYFVQCPHFPPKGSICKIAKIRVSSLQERKLQCFLDFEFWKAQNCNVSAIGKPKIAFVYY